MCVTVVALVLLLASATAEALRCGNRIVRDGMHEEQVRRICGEPLAVRHLGFVLRSYHPRGVGGISARSYRHGFFNEVAVTELVYNFGPRKLMRVLRFEGGFLVDIDTVGYGFVD
ncbi:MAG: DUF2845 domain-containing protein [Woeseiaceae bacterium]